MKDITDQILDYRECCRNIWNSYFLRLDWAEREIDYRDYFESINTILLEDTVFKQVTGGQEIQRHANGYYPPIKVTPRLGPLGYHAMYGESVDLHTQWHEIKLSSNSNDFRFIELFDWTVENIMDNQYVRVKLIDSLELPEKIGYDFLVECWSVDFFLI
ncbi:hypothetical protein BWI96_11855 [Siphonobacter sp. SORGH_AS_0500]|uniref:hypothetical protein n=1 Tax=Siphonobacter sp. SORGH_AS_0500 TaxID=1864824 RepID=UPI000CABC61A|nr:hypothetical protein [Siphonobacter sp. SORGH_AS_0500]PKK36542.1 hypothetical protein BWI96_11855 [Siphonobacter sp. SORGH_AS_0500]